MADLKLTVQTITGNKYDVAISSSATVADLKKTCERLSSIASQNQRLIFNSKRAILLLVI